MTRPDGVSATEMNAPEHATRYEALRSRALAPYHAPTTRDGLAVLLRQGVAAWMDAWSRLPAPAVQATRNQRHRPPLPDDASAEVVHILAAMAFGHIQEVPA